MFLSFRTVSKAVGRLPLAVLGFYVGLFAVELSLFPLWGPFSSIDEQLQYYQSGRNFDRFGFASTAFLPDLSSGSRPEQHPYLYNHQPPGPQLLIGALIRRVGENYRLIRLVFAALFLAGVVAFFRFSRIVEDVGIRHAALGFLFVSPRTIMHMIDHPAYSVIPLFAFLPILAAARYRRNGNRLWLIFSAATVFIAAVYSIYGPLIMVVIFWALGGLFRFLPMGRRELTALMAALASATVLHLLQTTLVVGPTLSARELWFTLSNRVSGYPTREQLVSFYDSIGFVLYGGHSLSPGRVGAALVAAVAFPGRALLLSSFVALVLIGTVAARISPASRTVAAHPRIFVRRLLRFGVWLAVPPVATVVLFPAFASDYSLYGVNEFLLGVFAVVTLDISFGVIEALPASRRGRWVFRAIMLAAIAWVAGAQLHSAVQSAKIVSRWASHAAADSDFLWVADHLAAKFAMTNVDPTVVGFFTREVAVGGCQLDSVASGRPEPSKCLVRFVRGWPRTVAEQPAAYVWFREGNAFCRQLPRCISMADLYSHYPEVRSTERMAVFDLNGTVRR